jgi:hypothetical protein
MSTSRPASNVPLSGFAAFAVEPNRVSSAAIAREAGMWRLRTSAAAVDHAGSWAVAHQEVGHQAGDQPIALGIRMAVDLEEERLRIRDMRPESRGEFQERIPAAVESRPERL